LPFKSNRLANIAREGSVSGSSTSTRTDLDSRYGRTRSARHRKPWIIAGAAALALVAGGGMAWGSLGAVNSSVDSDDVGARVIDQYTTSVSFSVSVKPGTRASCALQAQNEQHAIVGWKIVQLSPSEQFTRTFTEAVRTTERATTGLIYRCWLT
jgi:hypothetical protein